MASSLASTFVYIVLTFVNSNLFFHPLAHCFDVDVTPSSVAPGFRVRNNFIVFYHQLLGIG